MGNQIEISWKPHRNPNGNPIDIPLKSQRNSKEPPWKSHRNPIEIS
jgi:hypothetical protein